MNASPSLVLENVVKYADPDLKIGMMAKYDPTRPDPLQQASELEVWAQALKDEENIPKRVGKDTVNVVTDYRKVDSRKCYKCNAVGHIRRYCPEQKKKDSNDDAGKVKWSLAVHGENLKSQDWSLGSGASRHLVNDKSILGDVTECQGTEESIQPDGSGLKGTTIIHAVVDGVQAKIALKNAYYAPKLERNLISYYQLLNQGCKVTEVNGDIAVTKDGRVVFYADVKDNVLVTRVEEPEEQTRRMKELVMSVVSEENSRVTRDIIQQDTLMGFHTRFGHLSTECREDNQRSSFGDKDNESRAKYLPNLDLKGPVTPRDRCGNRYLVNFIDHKSNYCRVFLAKTKDQAVKYLEEFLVYFKKLFHCKVHVLRTDGGEGYNNVDGFCIISGVARQKSEVNNQAANAHAPHRDENMVLCMVFASDLPLAFWGDPAEYSAYILNRSPTRANEGRKSPMEVLTGCAPSLQDITVFGSHCGVFVDPNKKNLKKRSQPDQRISNYLPQDHKVIVTRHVLNIETLNGDKSDRISRKLKLKDSSESKQKETPDEDTSGKPDLRRSKRKIKKSLRRREADGEEDPRSEGELAVSAVSVEDMHSNDKEPANFATARQCAETEQDELASLEENNTWQVVKILPGASRLHTKWMYRKKRNSEGKIERYKARLVACGNEQVFGINYLLTFAAVMEWSSDKVLLAVARMWGVPARHGDVPNAYVKAPTEDGLKIYLHIPDGMECINAEWVELGVEDISELGLLLGRSLYGFKQADRLWRKLLHKRYFVLGLLNARRTLVCSSRLTVEGLQL
ncbi:Integrase, catalytic core protein [Phytophthora megakarya]|uniref:Integrase, catalytic core protein n=1 Tax=Phytophthora megakarya TaxID=4795 RepID=A0A225UZR2_9STRA|nr:Integrase, catalytic core protein [Phytophthora megakarya]